MDLGTNEEDRQLLRVLSASTHIGRPIFTTPDAPAERVAALRKAFDTMVHDPVFIEEAKREKFDIEPTTGEAMQKIVTEMMAMPKAQSERLKASVSGRSSNNKPASGLHENLPVRRRGSANLVLAQSLGTPQNPDPGSVRHTVFGSSRTL